MALSMILAAVVLVGGCGVVFGCLGRLWACNPSQAVFASRAMATDLVYGAAGVLYAGLVPAAVALAAGLLGRGDAQAAHAQISGGYGWLAGRPLWLQVIILLIATDFCQYWLHRAFHGRGLWPFHAIHHGAREVNWTTTFRVHPVNYLLYTTSLAILARLLGFAPQAFLLAAPIAFFSGALSHANLNWTFGPLRYLVSSPVFHRWHHTASPETRDRNFAPMFPVWDLMFGTFFMPAGRRPEGYGVEGAPEDIVGQLWRPFVPLATRLSVAPPTHPPAGPRPFV